MSHMGEYPALPTALDRLDPWTSRNAFGLPVSRASGPTDTDIADECDRLRRENAALRRQLHEIEEQRLELLRLAEARDGGKAHTDRKGDPR